PRQLHHSLPRRAKWRNSNLQRHKPSPLVARRRACKAKPPRSTAPTPRRSETPRPAERRSRSHSDERAPLDCAVARRWRVALNRPTRRPRSVRSASAPTPSRAFSIDLGHSLLQNKGGPLRGMNHIEFGYNPPSGTRGIERFPAATFVRDLQDI